MMVRKRMLALAGLTIALSFILAAPCADAG